MRSGAAVQEDALILRNAQFIRARFGHDDEGGRLIDEGAGRHQLGVGEAHQRVVCRDRTDLFSAVALATRGERIVLGDCGKSCEQFRTGLAVFVDSLARCVAQRLADQCVHRDGRAHAVLLFGFGVHALHAVQLVRSGRRVLAPLQLQAGALGCKLAAQRFAPHDERRLRFAVGDALAGARQHHHRRVAALWRIDKVCCFCRAHALGYRPWCVGELTERRGEARQRIRKQSDDGDGVQSAQQRFGGAAVRGGQLSGERADSGSEVVSVT